MRGRSCPAALFSLALIIQAGFALRAMAFEKSGLLDGIEYRFICTDVAQLKEKINSRGLPGPALTQQPDFVPPTQNFVPKRRFVRSVAVRRTRLTRISFLTV